MAQQQQDEFERTNFLSSSAVEWTTKPIHNFLNLSNDPILEHQVSSTQRQHLVLYLGSGSTTVALLIGCASASALSTSAFSECSVIIGWSCCDVHGHPCVLVLLLLNSDLLRALCPSNNMSASKLSSNSVVGTGGRVRPRGQAGRPVCSVQGGPELLLRSVRYCF